jgi:hypothetical protein
MGRTDAGEGILQACSGGEQFFDALGLPKSSDPDAWLKRAYVRIGLATFSSPLQWADVPLTEINLWADAIAAEQKSKRNSQ